MAAASAVPMTFFVAWAFGVVQSGRAFSPLQLLGLFPFVALVQLLIARFVLPDDSITVAAPVEQPPPLPNTRSSSWRSYRLLCAATSSRSKPRIIICAFTPATERP